MHGEVRQFADMGGIGLCASLHIIALQVVDVDALVVEHTIESVYRKLLIDAVDGGFYVLLTAIKIIPVDGTERGLVQVSATHQRYAK